MPRYVALGGLERSCVEDPDEERRCEEHEHLDEERWCEELRMDRRLQERVRIDRRVLLMFEE